MSRISYRIIGILFDLTFLLLPPLLIIRYGALVGHYICEVNYEVSRNYLLVRFGKLKGLSL
jgi:hypothetical protein